MTLPFPIVILAGGLATRLRPLTMHYPKSLIEVNGVPFISHQLTLLQSQGITEVILCVGFLGEMIQDYVGNGSTWGLNVQYSFDGAPLLGTAGAIKKAMPLIHSNCFFVMYGDSYLPCDFRAVQNNFILKKKSALMTIFYNQGKWGTSNVEFINGAIIAYDKINRSDTMYYIDYGLEVLSKNIFDDVPDNITYDLAHLYQLLLSKNELSGFEITERFYEIGSHEGLHECELFLSLLGAKE